MSLWLGGSQAQPSNAAAVGPQTSLVRQLRPSSAAVPLTNRRASQQPRSCSLWAVAALTRYKPALPAATAFRSFCQTQTFCIFFVRAFFTRLQRLMHLGVPLLQATQTGGLTEVTVGLAVRGEEDGDTGGGITCCCCTLSCEMEHFAAPASELVPAPQVAQNEPLPELELLAAQSEQAVAPLRALGSEPAGQ